MVEKPMGQSRNVQSRETGHIGYTRHRTKKNETQNMAIRICCAVLASKRVMSWVQAPVRSKPKTVKFVFVVPSFENTAARSKSKDWLARNRDNVSEWNNMSKELAL